MIQGSKVTLRMFEEGDLEPYVDLVNNLSNMSKYWPPSLQTKASLAKEFAENGFWKSDYRLLLVMDKEGRIIGEVDSFKSSPNIKGPEVGFRLFKKEDMKHGFMTEALQLFSAYLFQSDSVMLRLTLLIHSENVASLKVAQKCGYKREGTLRDAWVDYATGIPHPYEILSLLRRESPSLEKLLQTNKK